MPFLPWDHKIPNALINYFDRQIVQSGDGSCTLYLPGLNEHYHSVHGALQESLHVYIRHGFLVRAARGQPLRVLEVGLGTGLNCLLTFLFSREMDVTVHYEALEPFPLSPEEHAGLHHPERLQAWLEETGRGGPGLAVLRRWQGRILEGPWEKVFGLEGNFSLLKRRERVEEAAFTEGAFDLVYFDAFGPQAQPEPWQQAVFDKMFHCLSPGGVLVTYSAKGVVKRALRASGFSLEHPPGPPGKREISRGRKEWGGFSQQPTAK